MCDTSTGFKLFEQKQEVWKPEVMCTPGDYESDDMNYILNVFKRVNDIDLLPVVQSAEPLSPRDVFGKWKGDTSRSNGKDYLITNLDFSYITVSMSRSWPLIVGLSK